MANGIEQRVVVTDSAELLAPGIELLRDRGVTVVVVTQGTDEGGIDRAGGWAWLASDVSGGPSPRVPRASAGRSSPMTRFYRTSRCGPPARRQLAWTSCSRRPTRCHSTRP